MVESLPDFFDRIPDQSFILSHANQEATGQWLGDKLVSGMRSKSWMAVHLPHGGEVEVQLDEDTLTSAWRGVWLDPKTGAREVFKRGTGAGTLKAQSPTSGSLDTDWILLVERDLLPSA